MTGRRTGRNVTAEPAMSNGEYEVFVEDTHKFVQTDFLAEKATYTTQ